MSSYIDDEAPSENFKQIDAATLKALLASDGLVLLDIRDRPFYDSGHIERATHIEQIDLERFVAEQPKDTPLVIYCHHGLSSQSAAEYFAEQGFADVSSLIGGYAGWRP